MFDVKTFHVGFWCPSRLCQASCQLKSTHVRSLLHGISNEIVLSPSYRNIAVMQLLLDV